MLIVIMVLATALSAIWLFLMLRVNRDDLVSVAYSKVLDNMATIDKLRSKEQTKINNRVRYRGIAGMGYQIFQKGNIGKRINALDHTSKRIQNGDIRNISLLSLPGYVLQREYDFVGKSSIHKTILTHCYELHGKKYAVHKARQLLAKLLSYPIIGIALALSLGALIAGSGNTTVAFAVVGIGTLIMLVIIYAMFDELSDRVRKRRAEISKQIPNVVSKLALLVTSGMIMDRAWKETAYSQDSVIYMEMRKAADELDNLVSPEAAYGNFIIRCNTKETAKLASSILQNLSKGNAEIGILLKNMAHEAWQDRRRIAMRDAEKANAKLMIPTMLLFITILIMLMVPVAMNFSGI